MPQMITIGETMAAFTPASTGPLRYVTDYRMRIAGAESNVAIGAAKLGIDVAWVSRLGTDEFGQFIRNQTRAEGVDCRYLIFDQEHPTGIMFKETGAGETRVFYYRAGSAASHLTPLDLDEALFQGAALLHMTGITPVLSESCRQTTLAAFDLADHPPEIVGFPGLYRAAAPAFSPEPLSSAGPGGGKPSFPYHSTGRAGRNDFPGWKDRSHSPEERR